MKYTLSKTILILILFSCSLTVTMGQKVDKLSGKQFRIKLVLSLNEDVKDVCNIDKLPIIVKIFNSGKKPIVIDTLRVTRKIFVRATKSVINSDGESGNGLQINSDFTFPHFQVKPSYKILKPQESYEAQIFLDLIDSDLRTADFLHIQTDYSNSDSGVYLGIPVFVGSERSNEITLNLHECNANP